MYKQDNDNNNNNNPNNAKIRWYYLTETSYGALSQGIKMWMSQTWGI